MPANGHVVAVDQIRRLWHKDEKTKERTEFLIRIHHVQPAHDAGPKAHWVTDTRGGLWLFSIPTPPTPTT